jgi:pyruvate/2-oxoglutarate dehydrogenase complex dihydrolipoamide acyltransferase (E2) component
LAQVEVKVEELADGSRQLKITEWVKAEGDAVEEGEDLAEASTEKMSLYITAPVSGTLVKILAPAGSVVPVGQAVAIIET